MVNYNMAPGLETYCYDGAKSITLVKWKIRVGSQLFYNTTILSYKSDSSSNDVKEPLLKYKSNVGGTVVELLAKEGDLIQSGCQLLNLKPCTHSVIMKDLCAECGTDLRQLDKDNFAKLTASTTFSMVHVVPELKVSLEQAEKLGQDDEDRLLKNRKLVLLVDLDQTLIHTTNDNVLKDLPDVYHFQLYGPYSPWYHTKLRPGTATFLANISKYYELHICTFGARLYAHKIAQILDPDGKLFSHRILSRDECFDATSKTGNLKALFPRGDAMVCIIDDREDVWNFAPNVIHVKPYCFFRNTGDINAPPPSSNETQQIKPAEVSKLTSLAEPEGKNQNCDKQEKADDVKEDSSVLATHASNNDSTGTAQSTESASQAASLENEQNNVGKTSASAEESDTKAKNKEVDSLRSISDSVNNSDDYLLYLEEILVNVHKAYYDQYDKMKKEGGNSIPDLKTVVPDVRRKVLKGINIVFSSVIPTNCVPETSRFWTLAESLGATVSQELILDSSERRTTHVVASKLGTAKVNAAKKHSDICIVSLSWLLCCAERWERADERLFPLKKDFAPSFHDGDKAFNPNNEHSFYEQVVEKPVKGWPAVKRPHGSSRKRSRRHQLKSEEEIFSERIFVEAGLSLSQEDIEDMDREVDQVCSEESDKESEKMEPSSDSSSGESLSSGDYPKGWKRHRKNDVTDIALEDAIDESSDADTIGSVDEEIADAVKQEFGNY